MLIRIAVIMAALGLVPSAVLEAREVLPGPILAQAREVLPGPILAQVVSVYDGDTLTVRARVWLGQDVEVSVRLDGIDTPELRGKCEDEKKLARKAREFLTGLAGDTVKLRDIHYGKYAGRVIARVLTEDGEDLVAALINAGHGRPYSGGKRQGWCR